MHHPVTTEVLRAGVEDLDDLGRGEHLGEPTERVVVDRVVVVGEHLEEAQRAVLTRGEVRGVELDEARDVVLGDRVVLARLPARHTRVDLRAVQTQQLHQSWFEHPAPEGGLVLRVHRLQRDGAVRNDLERQRRRVHAVAETLVDDRLRLSRQLVVRDGLDPGHVVPPGASGAQAFLAVIPPSTGMIAPLTNEASSSVRATIM